MYTSHNTFHLKNSDIFGKGFIFNQSPDGVEFAKGETGDLYISELDENKRWSLPQNGPFYTIIVKFEYSTPIT